MKPGHWCCAFLIGLCSAAGAQSRVLYDVRVPTPKPVLSDSELRQVNAVARKAAQAQLWKDDAYCLDQDLFMFGKASGAFTAPNVKQTAYLYTSCIITHHFWRQGLVIMQGQKVVAHYIFHDLFTEMYSVKDINKNGYSELGLVREASGQGTAYQYLMLTELRPNRKVLLDEQVSYNDCAAMGREGWNSQVIRVSPASTPTFTKQLLTGTCGDTGPFRRLTRQGSIQPLTPKAQPTGWVTAPTS